MNNVAWYTCHRLRQLLRFRDSRWVLCGDMGVMEAWSNSCRRSSNDLYFSNSDISSPSRKASAVSKNHICFLTKCTTMVPPIRAPSYLFRLPSRCFHACLGATGRPDSNQSANRERKEHMYLREASTVHFLLQELQRCVVWKDRGQGEYSGF